MQCDLVDTRIILREQRKEKPVTRLKHQEHVEKQDMSEGQKQVSKVSRRPIETNFPDAEFQVCARVRAGTALFE